MSDVTLSDLVEKAEPIENQPVPITNRLRTAAWLSIATFLISLLVYNFLPAPEIVISSKFLLVMEGWLAGLVAFTLQHQSEFTKINAAGLIVAGILKIITRGFTQGRLIFQWLVLAITIIGAANGLLLVSMATIVVSNVLIYGLGAALILTILGLIIYFIVRR
jgi:hypothetical protein